MAKNYYTIKIHISRDNVELNSFQNIPYANSGVGCGDTVTFKKQTIIIEAERSKKMSPQEILYNNQNSLYRQIIKCILFLYLKNECRILLKKIDILRRTQRTQDTPYSITVDKYNQPVKADFVLRYSIPGTILDMVWQEGIQAEYLRTIFSYWLLALASEDRFYIFEQLWRSFERLAFYANRASNSKSEYEAIRNMKNLIRNNTHLFPDAMNEAHRISGRSFRSFDWSGYVKNEFPTLAASNKPKPYTEKYQKYFVLCNMDLRVIGMLKKTLLIRENELRHFGVYATVLRHITTHLATRAKYDEQLLTMLCCKYAYYFRNKMFHGEVLSHSFTFTEKTIENKNIDVLNTLLQSLTTDLILSFDRL